MSVNVMSCVAERLTLTVMLLKTLSLIKVSRQLFATVRTKLVETVFVPPGPRES